MATLPTNACTKLVTLVDHPSAGHGRPAKGAVSGPYPRKDVGVPPRGHVHAARR